MSLEFHAVDLPAALAAASDDALLAAPFGVVRMDATATVTLYNRWESQLSGLSPEFVLGKMFFEQVAPCTNNFMVALRYEQAGDLDETIDYVFTYRLAPTAVRLRMIKRDGGPRWLLVERRGR